MPALASPHQRPVTGPPEAAAAKYRRWNQKATLTRPISAGTSTSGPMTAAKAAPELMPKTATATAMASSKLLLAAVKERVALFAIVGAQSLAHAERRPGTSPRSRSAAERRSAGRPAGSRTMYSPLRVNMTTMVKSRAISVMGEIRGMNFF